MKEKVCFQHFNTRSSKFHFCLVGKEPCIFPGVPVPKVRRYLWRKKDVPFGREFPVSQAPTPDGTSMYSSWWTKTGGPIPVGGMPIYSSAEVPIPRIKKQGVVKQIRRIANSPTDPDSEGINELDGEELQIVNPSVGHPPVLHLLNFLPILSPIKPCIVIQEIPNQFYTPFHCQTSTSLTNEKIIHEAFPHNTVQAITLPPSPTNSTCGKNH
ncbi:hypothetical protein O181_036757 [Austropuccinia psidii MF-1]|uniref:Uncharacterized protein n=1 Tax=Austropuccinia psidii MF-1 TaxID=1389203 RepID=A0A9Q3DBB7_9BASI|nr:hypothetical protein [Austropuccinia psidii MF-1]